jgi:periplasmic divalent cation tolerance protein
MQEKEILIILVTVRNEESGLNISKELVKERLIACSNIIPNIRSVFLWEGKIQDSDECLLIMKTHSSKYKALEESIRKLHTYDTPEILALRVDSGNDKYIKWVMNSLGH